MHSTYSIDGGPACNFIPANTIVHASYHQKFFQSDTLLDGEHTLIITNKGREFWLDYLCVTQASHSATTAAASAASRNTQPLRSSMTRASPHIAGPATPNSTSFSHSETSHSFFGPLSQIKPTRSFSNTNSTTHTSTDSAVPAPSPTGSMSQSQSPTIISAIPLPSSASASVHSSTISACAIAGFAATGLLVVILVVMAGWRCSRHRPNQEKQGDLASYGKSKQRPAS